MFYFSLLLLKSFFPSIQFNLVHSLHSFITTKPSKPVTICFFFHVQRSFSSKKKDITHKNRYQNKRYTKRKSLFPTYQTNRGYISPKAKYFFGYLWSDQMKSCLQSVYLVCSFVWSGQYTYFIKVVAISDDDDGYCWWKVTLIQLTNQKSSIKNKTGYNPVRRIKICWCGVLFFVSSILYIMHVLHSSI